MIVHGTSWLTTTVGLLIHVLLYSHHQLKNPMTNTITTDNVKVIEYEQNYLSLTDIQKRNLEILVMDALYYVKKKKHSLDEEEINELLELF